MPDRTELRSVGRGAIGRGTYYTRAFQDPLDSGGVITEWISSGADGADDLPALAASKLPSVYPGTNVPLLRVRVRLWSKPGTALAIGQYGFDREGALGRFRETEIRPAYRMAETYAVPDDLTAGDPGTLDPNTGLLKMRRIPIGQLTIRRNVQFFGNIPPANLYGEEVGKVSRSSASIGGFAWAGGTLRFEGVDYVHDKRGGVDAHTFSAAFRYDSAEWQTGALDKSQGEYGTAIAVPLYDEDRYVSNFGILLST